MRQASEGCGNSHGDGDNIKTMQAARQAGRASASRSRSEQGRESCGQVRLKCTTSEATAEIDVQEERLVCLLRVEGGELCALMRAVCCGGASEWDVLLWWRGESTEHACCVVQQSPCAVLLSPGLSSRPNSMGQSVHSVASHYCENELNADTTRHTAAAESLATKLIAVHFWL